MSQDHQNDAAIAQIISACEAASRGDLEARVTPLPSDSKLAQLAVAINHVLDISDAFVRESQAAMEHCSRGEYHRPILERGLPGAYANAAGVINNAVAKMRTDSIALDQSNRQMRQSADTIAEHAIGTRGLAQEVAQQTEAAANNVNAVAAACQELNSCTTEISRQTDSSNQLTKASVQDAERASRVVGELSEAAKQIGSIAGVIAKIARQTNLLALNATIEAARAGEHGRGFAVVASEVKNLSRETAAATDRITKQLETMQRTTANVSTAITSIGASIKKVDETAGVISNSVREQVQATEEIAKRIAEVSQSTSAISFSIASVAQAAEGFEKVTSELKNCANGLVSKESANVHA